MADKRVTRVHRIETERPPRPLGYVHTSVCIASAWTNNSLPTSVGLSLFGSPTRRHDVCANISEIRSGVCPKNWLWSINYSVRRINTTMTIVRKSTGLTERDWKDKITRYIGFGVDKPQTSGISIFILFLLNFLFLFNSKVSVTKKCAREIIRIDSSSFHMRNPFCLNSTQSAISFN